MEGFVDAHFAFRTVELVISLLFLLAYLLTCKIERQTSASTLGTCLCFVAVYNLNTRWSRLPSAALSVKMDVNRSHCIALEILRLEVLYFLPFIYLFT